jgi:purine-nucleoside phosphorylase
VLHLASQIDEAAAAIRKYWDCLPAVGIILGTGLGSFTEQIDVEHRVGFEQIPHFPHATADGHNGRLLCGKMAGVNVLAMDGRLHAYEGYSLAQITMPVRVMKALGVDLLILSNASGGLNPNYRSGDILVIEDHINLMFRNPLIGINDDRLGPRFPDMSRPYCPRLIERALGSARRADFAAYAGVYVAVTGPNYETRAEYRLLRAIGGDAVGMSTVPEVIVAAHCGLRVLALSTITNICRPDALTPARHADVMATAAAAEPKLRRIVLDVLSEPAPTSESAANNGDATSALQTSGSSFIVRP